MKIFTDSIHKIAYSCDASVYREIPYGVAYPETVEDVIELLRIAREKGTHLIPRAGGTSIAGQVVGSGIVVDISKHWNKILEINPEEHWARVQPGVVRDELNIALKPYGLFFSPETSTSNRCCLGGMLGNNSCGTHSLVYGSTRHHTIEVTAVLADGSVEVMRDYTVEELEERFGRGFYRNKEHKSLIERIYAQLIGWAADPATRQLIVENYPDSELRRRSCGYAIDEVMEGLSPGSLTPGPSIPSEARPPVAFPKGEGSDYLGSDVVITGRINLCKLMAGSEGTLAFVTEMKVHLDDLPPKEIMVVCGHCDTLEKSFEANLVALRHNPTAIELMDGDVLALSKGNAEQEGNRRLVMNGWGGELNGDSHDSEPAALLITELRAETVDELNQKAEELEKDLKASGLVYHGRDRRHSGGSQTPSRIPQGIPRDVGENRGQMRVLRPHQYG